MFHFLSETSISFTLHNAINERESSLAFSILVLLIFRTCDIRYSFELKLKNYSPKIEVKDLKASILSTKYVLLSIKPSKLEDMFFFRGAII